MRKKISVLGSTGSIGVNTLEIISHLKDELEVVSLSVNTNVDLLLEQIILYKPKTVCIVSEDAYKKIIDDLDSFNIEVLKGRNGLLELAERDDVDIMVNALVGSPGMEPTIRAIKAGVNVALSNKESLVMAGGIINKELKKSGAKLFPVDSEHSAIWQCLRGEDLSDVDSLILTGSGGPFRKRKPSSFSKITIEEALKHPNWAMGKKITIDSATMMNKGLEVIEAYWLFGFKADKIKIVVHPQSIIHSMIEMKDGSIKAQMGVPDMKIPIQYALTYPRHVKAPWERINFFRCGDLTFQEPDFTRFPSIRLAFKALEISGSACAALNLANDYSVYRFLDGDIKFTDIPRINEMIIDQHPFIDNPSIDDLFGLNDWVKNTVASF